MADLLLVSEAPAHPRPAGDFEHWLEQGRLASVLKSAGGACASLFRILADAHNQGGAMPGNHIVLVERPSAGISSREARAALLSTPEVGRQYSAVFDRKLVYSTREVEPSLSVDTCGILFVLINNLLPERAADFEEWYNTTHVPDVVNAGSYWAGTRYVNPDASPGEGRFLAVYQTAWADPLEARARVLRGVPGMRLWGQTEQIHVAMYEKVADVISAPGRPPSAHGHEVDTE